MHACPGRKSRKLPRVGVLSVCLVILAVSGALALGRIGDPSGEARAASPASVGNVVFAIHGGAGDITRENLPPDL
jgi:hypothetical protein